MIRQVLNLTFSKHKSVFYNIPISILVRTLILRDKTNENFYTEAKTLLEQLEGGSAKKLEDKGYEWLK